MTNTLRYCKGLGEDSSGQEDGVVWPSVIENPPLCPCAVHVQIFTFKDAALVQSPRADPRHVQEGFQEYATSPFVPNILLIVALLILD